MLALSTERLNRDVVFTRPYIDEEIYILDTDTCDIRHMPYRDLFAFAEHAWLQGFNQKSDTISRVYFSKLYNDLIQCGYEKLNSVDYEYHLYYDGYIVLRIQVYKQAGYIQIFNRHYHEYGRVDVDFAIRNVRNLCFVWAQKFGDLLVVTMCMGLTGYDGQAQKYCDLYIKVVFFEGKLLGILGYGGNVNIISEYITEHAKLRSDIKSRLLLAYNLG